MKALTHPLAVTTAILTLTLSSVTETAFAGKPAWAEKSDATIVEFALENSGAPFELDSDGKDFDILVAALIATGTVSIFDGTDYTVFAPDDQAFYNLTGTDNDTDAFNAAVSLLGVDGIAAVLAYHVTDGMRNSRSIMRAKKVVMLDGNSIRYDNGLLRANQSDAEVTASDIRLRDGIVHLIDTVLIP